MKKNLILILFSLFLSTNINASANPPFVEKALLEIAEGQGYGYKTANLFELEKLILRFNTTNPLIPIQVPEFMGIPSSAVIQSLNDAHFDIVQEWKTVLDNISNEAKAEVFNSKQIPERFWVAQKQFITNLCAAFKKLDQKNPFNLKPEQLTKADALFANAQIDKLMVRSTGKEDTRKLANAGGNESIANVAPTMEAILAAAENVIISYFSEKSLNQRLGLGDTTLFTEEVFCPLLIQRMIGEIKGQEIPSCGVMFTEEVEGGTGYQEELDENGRIKTTGITIIQAAYGHNELVVNSKGAVDSFVAQMIDGKPVFYPAIRAKRKRLVPTPDGLQMVTNDKNIVTTSALNNQTLIALKQFANALEQHYGYPIDVEFVVRDNTLWIVQARPLTHHKNRKDIIPAYLEELATLPQNAIFKGRTIVSYGGALTTVEDSNGCIISERIGSALDNYQISSCNRIKAIFSGTDAPATSHEATTFRGEGKPVLYLPAIDDLRSNFTEGKKLIFSPQQHCALLADPEFEPKIKEGWCAYPLPRELSVVPALFIGDKKETKKEIEPDQGEADLKILLTEMTEENNENALEAAQIFPAVLLNKINVSIKNIKNDKDLNEQIKKIQGAARTLCNRIAWLIKNNASLLERLLPINYLAALVYQQTFGEKELQYLSVATLGKTLKQEQIDTSQDVVKIPLKAQNVHRQLKKIYSIIFDDETKNAWNSLLTQLTKNKGPEPLQALGCLVEKLQSFDILPLWLHSTMVNAVGKNPSTTTCNTLIKTWLNSFSESADSFNIIKQLSETVAVFDIGRFADPKKFDDAWKELCALLELFIDSEFTNIITAHSTTTSENASTQLTAAAACNAMSKFVELFDTSIKAMTGSQIWKRDKQPATFKIMLEAYYALLENWIELVPEGAILYLQSMPQKDFLDFIKNIINVKNKKFSDGDLKATSGFNAPAYTIGSGMNNSETILPKTGEDAFMLIHQNLLRCINVFTKTQIQNSLRRPALITALETTLKKSVKGIPQGRFSSDPLKPFLLSSSITNKKLSLHYNLPLRSHSSQFFLEYIHASKQCNLTTEFYGHRQDRWYKIAALAAFSEYAGLIASGNYIFTNNGASFTFIIKNEQQLSVLQALLSTMIESTFDDRYVNDHFDYFKKILPFFSDVSKKTTWQQLESFMLKKLGKDYLFTGYFIFLNYLQASLDASSETFLIATDAALEASTNQNKNITNEGLNLLEKVLSIIRAPDFMTQEVFEITTQTIAKIIENKNATMPNIILELLNLLIEQKQYKEVFKIAIQAVAKKIEDKNAIVPDIAISLLFNLVERQKDVRAFEIATQAITKVINENNNSNRYLPNTAFEILETLVKKKHQGAFDIATQAATNANKLPDFMRLQLFKTLVKQGQAFEKATKAANNAFKDNDEDTNQLAQEIFCELFAQGQGIEIGIKTASDALETFHVHKAGVMLFQELFKYKQAFKEGTDAASNAFISSSYPTRKTGLQLFKQLFKHNYAFEEATKAASDALNKGYPTESFELFYELVTYGQAFKQSIAVAIDALTNNNEYIQGEGLSLLQELVKHDQAKILVYKSLQRVDAKYISKNMELQELFDNLKGN